jgi:hypothetical protein
MGKPDFLDNLLRNSGFGINSIFILRSVSFPEFIPIDKKSLNLDLSHVAACL